MTLDLYFQAQHLLKQGYGLFSQDFFHGCPQLIGYRDRYSQQQLRQFLNELLRSVDQGHLLLYPGHDLYPAEYLHLEEVPYLLRYKGSPVWVGLPGLAVVGSREPGPLSKTWMDQQLPIFLQAHSCFLVSGGARGVDQKAHLCALVAERPTIVVLPSGLNRLYPQSLSDIQKEVLQQGGGFLSEYEDQRQMQKHFFVQRNRLISGLAQATLIIEAKRRSGTLITAQESVDQHRPVWILPGHPLDVGMQGSLDLLYEGAAPVRDAVDLISLFGGEIQRLTGISRNQVKHLVQNQPTLH